MKMTIIKKTDGVGKNTEKSEYLYVDENVKWYTHFGKVWQFLKMLSISPSNSVPRYLLERNKIMSIQKHAHECS